MFSVALLLTVINLGLLDALVSAYVGRAALHHLFVRQQSLLAGRRQADGLGKSNKTNLIYALKIT